MNKKLGIFFRRVAKVSYFLGSANLLVGLVLMVVHLPASAADSASVDSFAPGEDVALAATPTMPPDCTPPNDWDQTTRLKKSGKDSKEWSFNVDEPEMDVTLEFFYYQDYDRYGCPYTEADCSNGECQENEIGSGESPLGTFDVSDGILGPAHGKERQSGRLLQGSYTARFLVTGGSINIGLKVHRQSAPTDTPVPPTNTPTPIPTDAFTPTTTISALTPTATDSDLPTVLPPPPSDTPTPTATQFGADTPTPTPTSTPATPDTTVLPPPGTSTPTFTPTGTPPDTLEPPTRPSGTPDAEALIPETGFEFPGSGMAGSPYPSLFLGLGITILGLGVVVNGMGRQLDK